MAYPTIVGIVAVLIVVGMLLFIVPTFRGLFDDLGGTLPFTTRLIVAVSDGLKVAAPALVVLVVAGGAVWARVKHEKRVREIVDPLKLRMPVFGDLFRKVFLARMTRNLSGMLSAGVPMLQGLEVVGQTTGSTVIERALSEVREAVRNGDGLAGPMGEQKVFPPMVVQMVAVGEDSGSLDELLRKIAEYYDQEVESTTDSLTALIEPIMIVFLGSIVGFMIVSLYLPIFKVFELIQ